MRDLLNDQRLRKTLVGARLIEWISNEEHTIESVSTRDGSLSDRNSLQEQYLSASQFQRWYTVGQSRDGSASAPIMKRALPNLDNSPEDEAEFYKRFRAGGHAIISQCGPTLTDSQGRALGIFLEDAGFSSGLDQDSDSIDSFCLVKEEERSKAIQGSFLSRTIDLGCSTAGWICKSSLATISDDDASQSTLIYKDSRSGFPDMVSGVDLSEEHDVSMGRSEHTESDQIFLEKCSHHDVSGLGLSEKIHGPTEKQMQGSVATESLLDVNAGQAQEGGYRDLTSYDELPDIGLPLQGKAPAVLLAQVVMTSSPGHGSAKRIIPLHDLNYVQHKGEAIEELDFEVKSGRVIGSSDSKSIVAVGKARIGLTVNDNGEHTPTDCLDGSEKEMGGSLCVVPLINLKTGAGPATESTSRLSRDSSSLHSTTLSGPPSSSDKKKRKTRLRSGNQFPMCVFVQPPTESGVIHPTNFSSEDVTCISNGKAMKALAGTESAAMCKPELPALPQATGTTIPSLVHQCSQISALELYKSGKPTITATPEQSSMSIATTTSEQSLMFDGNEAEVTPHDTQEEDLVGSLSSKSETLEPSRSPPARALATASLDTTGIDFSPDVIDINPETPIPDNNFTTYPLDSVELHSLASHSIGADHSRRSNPRKPSSLPSSKGSRISNDHQDRRGKSGACLPSISGKLLTEACTSTPGNLGLQISCIQTHNANITKEKICNEDGGTLHVPRQQGKDSIGDEANNSESVAMPVAMSGATQPLCHSVPKVQVAGSQEAACQINTDATINAGQDAAMTPQRSVPPLTCLLNDKKDVVQSYSVAARPAFREIVSKKMEYINMGRSIQPSSVVDSAQSSDSRNDSNKLQMNATTIHKRSDIKSGDLLFEEKAPSFRRVRKSPPGTSTQDRAASINDINCSRASESKIYHSLLSSDFKSMHHLISFEVILVSCFFAFIAAVLCFFILF